LTRFATSFPLVAVIAHATLCALQAFKIVIVPATLVAAAGALAGKGCYSLRSHLAQ
jgi:hypothetical protein